MYLKAIRKSAIISSDLVVRAERVKGMEFSAFKDVIRCIKCLLLGLVFGEIDYQHKFLRKQKTKF